MPSYAWDTHTLKVNITTVGVTLTAYNLHAGQPGLDDVTITIYFSVKHMKYFLCKIYKLSVFTSNCLCVCVQFSSSISVAPKVCSILFVMATLKLTTFLII
jgi:hypothetical protein